MVRNHSTRTLLRRQKQGRLDERESDLLYRLVRLYEHAVDVLGSEDDARWWLKQPQWGLGGAVPLDYARTAHWKLYAYVLMEHHLHWIAEADELSHAIQRFKSFTARRLIDGLKQRKSTWMLRQLAVHKQAYKEEQRYQLWQEGNQPKQILGQEMLRQKIAYIHQNPVRGGYVDEPTHWRYSSARNYAGQSGLVPVMVVTLQG